MGHRMSFFKPRLLLEVRVMMIGMMMTVALVIGRTAMFSYGITITTYFYEVYLDDRKNFSVLSPKYLGLHI